MAPMPLALRLMSQDIQSPARSITDSVVPILTIQWTKKWKFACNQANMQSETTRDNTRQKHLLVINTYAFCKPKKVLKKACNYDV